MLEIYLTTSQSPLNYDQLLKPQYGGSSLKTLNGFLFMKIRIDQTDSFLFHLHGNFYFAWLWMRKCHGGR